MLHINQKGEEEGQKALLFYMSGNAIGMGEIKPKEIRFFSSALSIFP